MITSNIFLGCVYVFIINYMSSFDLVDRWMHHYVIFKTNGDCMGHCVGTNTIAMVEFTSAVQITNDGQQFSQFGFLLARHSFLGASKTDYPHVSTLSLLTRTIRVIIIVVMTSRIASNIVLFVIISEDLIVVGLAHVFDFVFGHGMESSQHHFLSRKQSLVHQLDQAPGITTSAIALIVITITKRVSAHCRPPSLSFEVRHGTHNAMHSGM